MKLKLVHNGKEIIFYSYDVIEKIKIINNALLDTYPETAEFCIKIDEVINEL